MSEQKNNQPKAQGEQTQQRKQSRWQRKGQYNPEQKKKDAEAIPILKYGPSNNFAKFKEAISKAALKQYGDLGRLIRQGSYYIPPEPNRATYGPFDTANDPDGLKKATYLEAMKHHQKKLASMEDDRARPFAMIMMYMIHQGGYETIIAYKERFNFALKLYEDQGNKKLDPEDIAMDFFRGLDNAPYSMFKTDYINGSN
jgi:hypothetical protein